MISHKHKCIFVHIPKAAGTSIERAFMDDLNLDMDNRHSLLLGASTNKSLGPRRVSHLLAKEYVEHHYISQELFDDYFKFAFVRNPFTRLYSTYKFLKFSDYLDFDTFIQKKLISLLKSKEFGFFLAPQTNYIYTNKYCEVDFVGKFENLKNDFQVIKEELNLSNLVLKHYNKTIQTTNFLNKFKILFKSIRDSSSLSDINYRNSEYKLDSTSKDIIYSIYERDFDNFDYNKDF